MSGLPTGTVTFLFTDIEASTLLAQKYPEAMPDLLARHNQILRQAIEGQRGYTFQVVGDAFCAAFPSPLAALNAAIDAQRSLCNEPWSPAPIKVRMGIHTGAAQLTDDGQYSGYATLASSQRIMAAGHGGQILLSGATRELVRVTLPEDAELLDLGQRRLKDLLHSEHLYQLRASGLPSSFPPLRTLNSFPNNLPAQLTTFVGREKEIAELIQELSDHRLVTLTGAGGTGKTRLSLQVAADLLEKFDHGIWFVELALLTDPDLIPQAILSAVGIQEQHDKDPLELLKEYLHEKETLIVLDNCEHLIEASSKVVNVLLNTAPKLRILASSREALGVGGEVSYPVPSLALPDMKHLPAVAQLSQYEAVRLFLDRALLVDPHFVVNEDNASHVAQICHRLDGIPLAIELAAARVRVLSVDQISRRLDDRFRLLAGGARTALPRQQTLRALIDWSYDLLSENERLLLCRLSIFVGGWTLEASEEVCSGGSFETYEVLDLLTQLVNKSLVVVVDRSQSGGTRYRMLETIRQYAREKLLESAGAESVRNRHLDYYLRVVKQGEPGFFGPKEMDWLAWLEQEWDNLRSAMTWAIETRPEVGLQLAKSLGYFLLDHFYASDEDAWMSELIPSPVNSPRTTLRAHGLLLWAWCIVLGREDLSSAQSMIEEALSIFKDLGDKQGVAQSRRLQGLRQFSLGSPHEGVAFLEQALDLFREMGDRPWMANSLLFLGFAMKTAEYARKLSVLEESLSHYRDLGYVSGMIEALKQLGAMELRQGRFREAHIRLDEAHGLLESHASILGDSRTVAYDLGDLAFHEGSYDLAQEHYEDCLVWAEKRVQPVGVAYARTRLGNVFLRRGDGRTASLYFSEALRSFRTIGNSFGINFALDGLASLAVLEKRWQRAVTLLSYATLQHELLQDPRPPVEQAAVEKDLEIIRSQLDDFEFGAFSAQGRTMTMEQAIEYALEIPEDRG